jgi:hypothetical protein
VHYNNERWSPRESIWHKSCNLNAKRELTAADLVRHADQIRLTYLTIRDALNTLPQLANTDGDPLVFHTLKFVTESADEAFEALAPLSWGQSREDPLVDAKFGKDGKLQSIMSIM